MLARKHARTHILSVSMFVLQKKTTHIHTTQMYIDGVMSRVPTKQEVYEQVDRQTNSAGSVSALVSQFGLLVGKHVSLVQVIKS